VRAKVGISYRRAGPGGDGASVRRIVATAVLHLMLRFVPRPKVFFFWLASLAMIASLLAPLSLQITDKAKVWLCSMHVVVGVVIISLLLATASRVMVTGPRVLDEPLTGPPGAI
jgi:hypothetical protein